MSGLDRGQRYVARDEGDTWVVRSGVPMDLDTYVKPGRPNIVFGDQITVRGSVRTEGYPITVCCRQLVFAEGSSIDTTGVAGLGHEPGLPPSSGGLPPGAAGPDGFDAGPGAPGGAIVLSVCDLAGHVDLRATGGRGGRGGDGGAGRDGAPGPSGQPRIYGSREDWEIVWKRTPDPGQHGQKGHPGGAAGLPGRPGAGGRGGDIIIRASRTDEVHSQGYNCAGGATGEPGRPGAPGEGGAGGPGGELSYREYVDTGGGGMHEHGGGKWETRSLGSAPAGPQGDRGDARSAEAEAQWSQVAPAQAGTLTIQTVTQQDVAAGFDVATLGLLALTAEDDFRSAGARVPRSLKARIEFLLLASRSRYSDADEPARDALLVRAYAMARSVLLGLDFYGHQRDWVPRRHALSLLADVSSFLEEAHTVQDAFYAYWDKNAQDEELLVSAARAADEARRQAVNVRERIQRTAAEGHELLREIDVLDARVADTYAALLQRKDEFDRAIQTQEPQCDVVGVALAAASVISGLATGIGAIGDLASAGAMLLNHLRQGEAADKSALRHLWDNRRVLRDDLRTMNAEVKDLKGAIDDIRAALRDLAGDAVHPKDVNPGFVLERTRLNEIAARFLEVPEAEALREAGYAYLDALDDRNEAILLYNALLTEVTQLYVLARSADEVVLHAVAAFISRGNPASAAILTVMERAYNDVLTLAARMVYWEARALAYLYVDAESADTFPTFNISVILGAHAKNRARATAATDEAGVRKQLPDGMVALDLRTITDSDQEQWRAFKRTGRLAFRIDKGQFYEFDELPGLRITGVVALTRGARFANEVPWVSCTLTHSGPEVVYRPDGAEVHFTHRPREFKAFFNSEGNPIVLGSSAPGVLEEAGVSPFARWTFAFEDDPRAQLDLAELERVTLRFSGYYLQS